MLNFLRPSFFLLLLLLSGFCGISYEILYGRILGNIAGDQFSISAAILLTFLLGIGFGSRHAFRLWSWLWLIEAIIGLYALLFVIANPLIVQFIDLGTNSWAGQSIIATLIFCIVLLLIPAFLIGCSLPLFAGYLQQLNKQSKNEKAFHKAYAIYNLGAAITALFIEFWLIRKMGIADATLAIAVLNGLVAISLKFFFSDIAKYPPITRDIKPTKLNDPVIIGLIFAGIGSAIFQLIMLKLSESFLGPFRETFALVLSLILIGITLGSWWVKSCKIRFDTLMLTALVGIIWLIAGMEWMLYAYAQRYEQYLDAGLSSVLFRLIILAFMMLIPAMAFGSTITSLIQNEKHVALQSGRLLYVVALANAAGFLIMSLLLHRWLDYGVILLIIAFLSVLGVIFYQQSPSLHSLNKKNFLQFSLFTPKIVLAIALFTSAFYQFKYQWDEHILYLGYLNFHSTEKLQEERESFSFPQKIKGYQDVISINWYEDRPFLFINGYISMPLNSPNEKMVGAFSSLFAPDNKQALVLGLGSGATAGTVARLYEHTDIVEINEALISNLELMEKYNFALHKRDNISIIKDDAIRFSRINKKHYSLIINTVTTPLYFSSSKLYTVDFLNNINNMLEGDGIYATWVDYRIGDKGMDITLATLNEVFKFCAVGYIRDEYFLLLCSQKAIKLQQGELVNNDPVLSDYFYKEDINPPWLHYALMHSNTLEDAQKNKKLINTLDFPILEFSMTQLQGEGFDNYRNQLVKNMSIGNIASMIPDRKYWTPSYLYAHTEMVLGKERIKVLSCYF